MRLSLRVIALLLLPAAVFAHPAAVFAQKKDTVDYHKADLIRTASAYALGTSVSPTYLEDSVRFWYKSRARSDRGVVYLVDPARSSRKILFDNARMAAALSTMADTILDPGRFPRFSIVDTGKTLELTLKKKVLRCGTATYTCQAVDSADWAMEREIRDGPSWASPSPDKKWDVFTYDYNLYARPVDAWNADARSRRDSIKRARSDTAKKKAAPAKDSVGLPSGSIKLTNDGVKFWAYGLGDMFWNLGGREPARWQPTRVNAAWSPNSKKFALSRTDSRGVRTYPMYSSTGDQPIDKSYQWAAPGDSIVSQLNMYIIDVDAKSVTKVQDPPSISINFTPGPRWSRNSDKVFSLVTNRGYKMMGITAADANTGVTVKVMRDSFPTWVDAIGWQVANGGEDIVALSERDGWQHLYRFAANGTLKNQIESGAYRVNGITYVDSTAKQIYFMAQGREEAMPYYARLYRVNFDGSGFTLLTPEEGTHQIAMVPKGPYFIDTYSTVDKVPVTVLRAAGTGHVMMELGRGDAQLLRDIGWTPGEVFSAKARDGVTDIWGIMFKPSNFDPKKSYPIISHIYPGPQSGSVRGWGFGGPDETRAIAELGFIVIQLNHQGTPGRSKSFQDFYYGRMSDNGLPDHVAAIRQLAAKYPWIDINRVGMFGASGGGFATADAMFRYPDFFKVGVADAGNHDQRTYHYGWGEKYQGLLKKDASGKDNFDAEANYTVAKNLRGKLLLMCGDMDSNVHPAATLRVVDALIKANRNFDMLIIPDGGHGVPDFGMRKRWDYFVRYLMGAVPPADYEMMRPERTVE